MQEALRGKVTVLIDDRDQRELDKLVSDDEDDSAGLVKTVEVGRHVT